MDADGGWEYRNPTRIVAGLGSIEGIGNLARGRVLLVTTPGTTERGLTGRIVSRLGARRVVVHDRVAPNPTLDALDESIDELRGERVDTVVAVGGGSAIDSGKVLALAHRAGKGARVRDLAESGLASDGGPNPLVAVPTTAGTGSEVTPFATVWDGSERRKLSVTSPRLFPEVAVVDAALTLGLDWEQTVSSGLDAYVQCFEAICNRNASPVTSAFAERGLALVPGALRRLRAEPDDVNARLAMADAALLSGLAISHTRTALAHSMSYPITAHLGVPHGLACAFVLPAVLEFNLGADDGRLAALAQRSGLESPHDLLTTVVELFRELDLAELVSRRVPRIDVVESLAGEMLTPLRADNNLRAADVDDVRGILGRTADLLGVGATR